MATLQQRLERALEQSYTIEREIGGGGTAVVFLARDMGTSRAVALKVLRPELASVVGWERFQREIQFAGRLRHPNILPLVDSGRADGLPYSAFPFLEDGSLRERLRGKPVAALKALEIVRQVSAGLAFAHQQGIIHRDIKPDNLLLDGATVVIADLGLARALDRAGGEKLTATGTILGTPAYMSPEQATGSRDLDARSDIYSLGCVLYELLTGKLLFTGSTPEELIRKRFGPVSPGVEDIADAGLSRVFSMMTAKRPADRFQTVDELLAALDSGDKHD